MGEGYSGELWSIGGSQTRNFNLPTLANSSTVELECYVSGQSDAVSANPNFNHHIQLNLQGNGNTLLLDTTYKGYTCVRKRFNLSNTLFSTNNSLQFLSINDLGAQSDFNSSPYLKLKFKQKTNLTGQTYLAFSHASTSNTSLYFNGLPLDSTLLWNLNTRTYYSSNLANDSIHFNVDAAATKQAYVIASIKSANLLSNFSLEKAVLKEFDYSHEENELIIVTSKAFENAAQQYAQYKTQKGQASYVVYAEDLYNTYSFGYHHPIAIKKFVDAYLATAKENPLNLFIIGKGIQSNLYANPNFAKRDFGNGYKRLNFSCCFA